MGFSIYDLLCMKHAHHLVGIDLVLKRTRENPGEQSFARTPEQEFKSGSSVLRGMVNSLTDFVCQADGRTFFIPCKPKHHPVVLFK